MIWWGARNGYAPVGAAGVLHCRACGQDSSFTRVVSYRMRHVYSLFRWVTGRQLHDVCGNCGATHAAAADPNAPEVTAAIPRFHRRGWLIGGGILAASMALLAVLGAVISSKHAEYANTPQVGDVYVANLAGVLPRPEASTMWGAMRIVDIRGDQVEMELSRAYYPEARGVDQDVHVDGQVRADYWAPDHLALTRAALRKLYDEGVASDVRRPGETW